LIICPAIAFVLRFPFSLFSIPNHDIHAIGTVTLNRLSRKLKCQPNELLLYLMGKNTPHCYPDGAASRNPFSKPVLVKANLSLAQGQGREHSLSRQLIHASFRHAQDLSYFRSG
jgi:hypothetical protein